MTRFPRLWALLTGKPHNPRQDAREAYLAALQSGDTREMHRTYKALRDATNAELRGTL